MPKVKRLYFCRAAARESEMFKFRETESLFYCRVQPQPAVIPALNTIVKLFFLVN